MKSSIADKIVGSCIVLFTIIQPAVAIYGIFKFIPVSPENEWRLYLSILVLLCCIFTISKEIRGSKPAISRDVDEIISWIGFTIPMLFFIFDEKIRKYKKVSRI